MKFNVGTPIFFFLHKTSFEINKEKEKMLSCGRETDKICNCFH